VSCTAGWISAVLVVDGVIRGGDVFDAPVDFRCG
jgi:hypothetical protein